MIDWWTFSHGLAFGIGGLVTLAVMLVAGWRYCDGCVGSRVRDRHSDFKDCKADRRAAEKRRR